MVARRDSFVAMAVYTTLFSATLVELEYRFPNVAEPLATPRVVQRRNPFTKKLVDVHVFEPEFGPPRHEQSLFAKDDRPAVKPVFVQDDDYGHYLDSVVPDRLRGLPHLGTKNITFLDAEEALQLDDSPPELFVQCLPGEGVVDVATALVVETLTGNTPEHLRQRFPEAEDFPLEWLRELLLAFPGSGRRYLCAWFRG